ncbi:MAG: acetamidase/formamidase family protein [Pseudonocardia sp.]|nr:acetamidase/formamidase family protein [Pseudonocardia sp.]
MPAGGSPRRCPDSASCGGRSPQQTYTICSVDVDLKISQLVDVPNFIVTAALPLDILV